jgi:hypothetical protein
MRSTRLLAVPVIVCAAALNGCSMQAFETRAAYEPVTDVASASATPMAVLSPSAGDVVSVLQSRVEGILTQRIVLRGDPQTEGENQIVVKVDQSKRLSTGVDGPVAKPTESLIASELADNFSGVDMRLSTTFNRNSFGPFGYAIGHPSPKVTCIYAWQYQGYRVLPIVGSAGELASSTSLPAAPTSVRVRLCKSKIGEPEIVAMLQDMVVYPPGSTEPYQDPAVGVPSPLSHRDALGAAGVPGGAVITPKTATTADGDAGTRVRRHGHGKVARHHRHHDDAVGIEAPPPVSNGPIVNVPLPGGATTATASPTSAAQNPLLAPLQAAAPARATTGSDMPLPPRGAASVRGTAPVDAPPAMAPVPMPN